MPDDDDRWTPFDLFAYLHGLRAVKLADGDPLLDRDVVNRHLVGLLGVLDASDRAAALELLEGPSRRGPYLHRAVEG